ncbi:MAG: hypothetical protein KIG94_00645, partial [Acetatifactor sp.]|nr:hypothetical protein [Acetatifactor sp.]
RTQRNNDKTNIEGMLSMWYSKHRKHFLFAPLRCVCFFEISKESMLFANQIKGTGREFDRELDA